MDDRALPPEEIVRVLDEVGRALERCRASVYRLVEQQRHRAAGEQPTTSRQHLLNVKEAAQALHVSERTIYRLCASGDLKPLKMGRASRFSQDDLAAYVERLRAEQY